MSSVKDTIMHSKTPLKDTIMHSKTPLNMVLSKQTEKIIRSINKSKNTPLKKGNTSFKTYLKNCCGYKCANLDILDKNIPGFVCEKILGEGGFGATFLFKNSKNEKIALKVIQSVKKYDSSNEEKILKLLKTSCSKKRVLCYNSKFSEGNTTFFVTEYIEGQNLDDYIIKSKKSLYIIIGQLIDAVEYIHSKNIIHFDIKPENIMITGCCDLKLIDFGGASLKSFLGNVKITASTSFYAPKFTDRNISFKQGKYFDFYTVMTTLIQVLKHVNNIPEDLKYLSSMTKKDLVFDSSIMNHIDDVKRVVNSHIASKNKSFMDLGFNNKSRNLVTTKMTV